MANMTLAGFISHIATAQHRIEKATHKALEKAARIVEAEAKRELGHYQSAAGPFVAWAELAPSTKDQRVRLGFTENDPGLRSGEMLRSISHVVGDKEAVIGSNDQKMVWFELGTGKQPPRSALGGAAFRKEKQIVHALASPVVTGLMGNDVHNGYFPIK